MSERRRLVVEFALSVRWWTVVLHAQHTAFQTTSIYSTIVRHEVQCLPCNHISTRLNASGKNTRDIPVQSLVCLALWSWGFSVYFLALALSLAAGRVARCRVFRVINSWWWTLQLGTCGTKRSFPFFYELLPVECIRTHANVHANAHIQRYIQTCIHTRSAAMFFSWILMTVSVSNESSSPFLSYFSANIFFLL